MSVLVYFAVFYAMTDTPLWDLPGDVLAAPASALCGWEGVLTLQHALHVILSLSLPLTPSPPAISALANFGLTLSPAWDLSLHLRFLGARE